jgi:cytochrome P450
MNESPPVKIYTAEFKADPFPFFARLRVEQPVYRTVLPDKTPVWLVTRYNDVLALLKDERFAKNRRTAMTPEQLRKLPWTPAMFRPLERNMLDLDPPDHERLRMLVHKAFTPRMVEQMRARVQAVADELLTRAAGRSELELVRDFALPLPVTVITEILGVPPADRGKFHKWSQAIVALNSLKPPLSVLPNVWLFTRFLRRLFRIRRAEPRDDLTTALLQAEEAGDKLSEDELLAMAFLLLIAGHETTVSLIAGGTLDLLGHPDQLEKLRQQPALIQSAVEELLRFTSPVMFSTERFARADVTLEGVPIPRGGLTFGVLGSANRDAAVFENPDTLEIARQNNRHLAFGHGIHFCLGAALARLEAQIAIPMLLERFPRLRLAVPAESLRWRPSLILRSLDALPLVV